MKDITEALGIFGDRMKSHFYKSFLFTWCVVNWKILVFLFNYKNSGCNCGLINCIQYYINSHCYNILYKPLLYSIGIIILLPIMDFGISWFKSIVNSRYLKHIKYNKKTLYSGIQLQRKDDEIERLLERSKSLDISLEKMENLKSMYENLKQTNENIKKTIPQIFGYDEWKLKIDDYIDPITIIFQDDNIISQTSRSNSSLPLFNIINYKYDNTYLKIVVEQTKEENILDKVIKHKNYGFFEIRKINDDFFKGEFKTLPSGILEQVSFRTFINRMGTKD